jgi:hypothetical protein
MRAQPHRSLRNFANGRLVKIAHRAMRLPMADYTAGTKARNGIWFGVPSPHGINIGTASAFIGAHGAVSLWPITVEETAGIYSRQTASMLLPSGSSTKAA